MKFKTTIAINGEERSHFVVYQFNKQDEIDFKYSGRDIRINRISETITKLI